MSWNEDAPENADAQSASDRGEDVGRGHATTGGVAGISTNGIVPEESGVSTLSVCLDLHAFSCDPCFQDIRRLMLSFTAELFRQSYVGRDDLFLVFLGRSVWSGSSRP